MEDENDTPPIFSFAKDLDYGESKTDTPKEEKSKETKVKVSLPQSFAENFVDNCFKSIALIGGKHWELDKNESKDLAKALKPVLEKHIELIIKYLMEINLVVCLIRIIVPRIKLQIEEAKEKKQKQDVNALDKMIEAKIKQKVDEKDLSYREIREAKDKAILEYESDIEGKVDKKREELKEKLDTDKKENDISDMEREVFD